MKKSIEEYIEENLKQYLNPLPLKKKIESKCPNITLEKYFDEQYKLLNNKEKSLNIKKKSDRFINKNKKNSKRENLSPSPKFNLSPLYSGIKY